MPTRKYPLNGKDYQIGTIAWVGTPWGFLSKRNGLKEGIPTYGLWAGPGWSGGTRPANVQWTVDPCRGNVLYPHPERFLFVLLSFISIAGTGKEKCGARLSFAYPETVP